MIKDAIVSLAVLFATFFVGIVVSTESQQQCSSFCVCDSWYGLQRASCTGRHLYSIDTGASNNVQALDLSDNVVSLLSDHELMEAGFTKLKYLNLSGNSISEISLNAFDGLDGLTVLDLSKNRLYYLLSDVFARNNNLRMLKLSRNNFNSHVPRLRSSSLMELSLDSCQISHLPLDTFNGLTHVRRLDLSNNLMIQMSSTVVQTLHLLKKLSLEGNPWSCNKLMYDLQVHLKNRNVEFEEVCGKKSGPKKFEKMIMLPERKPHHHTVQKTVMKPDVSVVLDIKNLSKCENTSNQQQITDSAGHLVPYWCLCIGFIAGISSGMVISYMWLSETFRCRRRCSHRERLNQVSQRLSLLFDSYLQNRANSDASLIESCPGTPPPPYREVMLRPNFYRSPSTAPNLNNNGTGHR